MVTPRGPTISKCATAQRHSVCVRGSPLQHGVSPAGHGIWTFAMIAETAQSNLPDMCWPSGAAMQLTGFPPTQCRQGSSLSSTSSSSSKLSSGSSTRETSSSVDGCGDEFFQTPRPYMRVCNRADAGSPAAVLRVSKPIRRREMPLQSPEQLEAAAAAERERQVRHERRAARRATAAAAAEAAGEAEAFAAAESAPSRLIQVCGLSCCKALPRLRILTHQAK